MPDTWLLSPLFGRRGGPPQPAAAGQGPASALIGRPPREPRGVRASPLRSSTSFGLNDTQGAEAPMSSSPSRPVHRTCALGCPQAFVSDPLHVPPSSSAICADCCQGRMSAEGPGWKMLSCCVVQAVWMCIVLAVFVPVVWSSGLVWDTCWRTGRSHLEDVSNSCKGRARGASIARPQTPNHSWSCILEGSARAGVCWHRPVEPLYIGYLAGTMLQDPNIFCCDAQQVELGRSLPTLPHR